MDDDITADTVYTVPEAIRRLKCSKSTFYRAKRAGEIQTVKFRRRTLVPITEVDRILNVPRPPVFAGAQ